MLDAITSTFSELWNMRDPNASANPFRVGQPKKKEAIRRYLARLPTTPAKRVSPTQPNAPKRPIRKRLAVADPPPGAARDT